MQSGGRGGIRTHVGVSPKPDFESGTFNHSATLPLGDNNGNYYGLIKVGGKIILGNVIGDVAEENQSWPGLMG